MPSILQTQLLSRNIHGVRSGLGHKLVLQNETFVSRPTYNSYYVWVRGYPENQAVSHNTNQSTHTINAPKVDQSLPWESRSSVRCHLTINPHTNIWNSRRKMRADSHTTELFYRSIVGSWEFIKNVLKESISQEIKSRWRHCHSILYTSCQYSNSIMTTLRHRSRASNKVKGRHWWQKIERFHRTDDGAYETCLGLRRASASANTITLDAADVQYQNMQSKWAKCIQHRIMMSERGNCMWQSDVNVSKMHTASNMMLKEENRWQNRE